MFPRDSFAYHLHCLSYGQPRKHLQVLDLGRKSYVGQLTGGLVEVYVKIGGRKEAFVNPVKRENEYFGFLKTTFSTLKLFWDLEPQQQKLFLQRTKFSERKKKAKCITWQRVLYLNLDFKINLVLDSIKSFWK